MKTPWINFRRMEEVSSKQNKYTNWTYQITPSHCGENNLLDIEKTDETSYVEELDLDSNRELLIPSKTNVEEEISLLADAEDADEVNLKEELDLAAILDSSQELLIPSETNVEEEIDHFPDTEEVDAMNPEEELDLASTIDSTHELIPPETNVGEEVGYLPNTEEADEINSVEELQVDSTLKFFSRSESDVENKIDTEELTDNLSTNCVNACPEPVHGEVCSIAQNIPFSTYVEINDFLHAPICGENVQNTFEFLDLNNKLIPQPETKLFNSITDYPEQPDCRLARSKINQIIFLMRTDTFAKNDQKNSPPKSVVVPLHKSQSIKKGEINNHSYSTKDCMHIRVPVVVGEYKIEICLEEYIDFEKGIVGIKDISSEAVLTNCKFVPNHFSKTLGNGTCTALKGNLFIEGYIHQNLEYTNSYTGNEIPVQNNSFIHSNRFCQNIVLELIIHMLQVQKIRVSYDKQMTGG
ncbi:BC_2427 family protein [Lysinibacillus sp. NPDC047702]|uniref:BC_2427 family protein n=1 Tax=unclassified Lysinibacillus TaxID=2636778 RepID=UPI003D056A8B